MKEPIQMNSLSVEDEKTYICSNCGINETRMNFFKAKGREVDAEQLELTKKFREKLGLGK